MTRYKFRAELLDDINLLRRLFPDSTFEIIPLADNLPDMEVSFECSLSIAQVREIINLIPDSHVIAETLAVEPNYTGERTYQSGLVAKNN